MDYLSDLANWIIGTAFGAWLSTSETSRWIFAITYIAILLIGATVFIWRYGDVRMGPPPEMPKVSRYALPAAPVKVGSVHYWNTETVEANSAPFREFIKAVDEAAVSTFDLADTVEMRPVDPLDVTAEIEHIDPSVPLFYAIRRPPPLHLESFTVGWSRERIAEIVANGRPS